MESLECFEANVNSLCESSLWPKRGPVSYGWVIF